MVFPVAHHCETVLQSGSDYGPYLANEASPLHTTTIVERCTEKLVDDWNRMRANVSCRPPSPYTYLNLTAHCDDGIGMSVCAQCSSQSCCIILTWLRISEVSLV